MRRLILDAISDSEGETIKLGERLGAALRSRAVVGLVGPLGAGKTRLVQGIVRGSGYQGRVRSPTFALMNLYRGPHLVRHFDFYRLETIDVGTAGEWEEEMETEGLSLIEWADRLPELLPSEALWIDLVPPHPDATAGPDRMQSSESLPRPLEALLNPDQRLGITLAFETSGRLSGLAILEDDRLIAEAAYDNRRTETELLLDTARSLLAENELCVGELTRIAFSEGPGSFTGLRVGMAAALGIAAGADLPVVPVPTLEVLAFPWREIGSPIVVASGLRRGHLYLGAYLWSGERMVEQLAPASRSVETVGQLLTSLGADDLLLVGDAVGSLRGMVDSRPGRGVRSVSGDPARASHVAILALDPNRPSWAGLEREGKTPRYLRDADARKPANRSQGHPG